MNWHVALLAFAIVVPPLAYIAEQDVTGRRIRRRLAQQAERAGLTVHSILGADRSDHPWPKVRVVTGAFIPANGSARRTVFHFLLFVKNTHGVETELWARFERSPIPLVFGPPIIEWRPPLETVARATGAVEPVRDEKRVIEPAKFGPFAKRRAR